MLFHCESVDNIQSGKKQGAQDGHDGVHLSVIAEPDDVVPHMHADCTLCPYHDSCLEKACVKATVQYSKNLQAMVIAFNTVGAVSINRTHEILSSVFNIPLSTRTIKNMVGPQCIRYGLYLSEC